MEVEIRNGKAYIKNDISVITGEAEVDVEGLSRIVAGRDCRVILEDTNIDVDVLVDINNVADIYVRGITDIEEISDGRARVCRDKRWNATELMRIQQRTFNVLKSLSDNSISGSFKNNAFIVSFRSGNKVVIRIYGYFRTENEMDTVANEVKKVFGTERIYEEWHNIMTDIDGTWIQAAKWSIE